MVWDLRGALLKKQEFETARLLDFEFRLRARTMRLLAEVLGRPLDDLVGRIVFEDDASIVHWLAWKEGLNEADIQRRFAACREKARTELVAKFGDPAPHRLS